MKVLHVIPSMASQTGGPPVSLLGIALSTGNLGVESRIVTTDALAPAQSHQRGGGATLLDCPPGSDAVDIRIFPVRRPYRLTYSPALGRELAESSHWAEVIHIHSLNLYPQFAAWRAAVRLTRPYIVSPRGALDPWLTDSRSLLKRINNGLWQSKMLMGADMLHFTALAERDLAIGELDNNRWRIIPNGVNTARFRHGGNAQLFREKYLPGYSGPIVLNHGRIAQKKGLDILIRAFAAIQDVCDSRLLLIGSDDEGEGKDLAQLASSLGVESKLTILPALDGQELVDAVAAADVWVLPSHGENFGVAVFEAMAAGRAVVTSPQVNTAPEAAMNNALVMTPNSPTDVSRAVLRLINNPIERLHLGANALDYARRFSWENIAPTYVQMYEDVVACHESQNSACLKEGIEQ